MDVSEVGKVHSDLAVSHVAWDHKFISGRQLTLVMQLFFSSPKNVLPEYVSQSQDHVPCHFLVRVGCRPEATVYNNPTELGFKVLAIPKYPRLHKIKEIVKLRK